MQKHTVLVGCLVIALAIAALPLGGCASIAGKEQLTIEEQIMVTEFALQKAQEAYFFFVQESERRQDIDEAQREREEALMQQRIDQLRDLLIDLRDMRE